MTDGRDTPCMARKVEGIEFTFPCQLSNIIKMRKGEDFNSSMYTREKREREERGREKETFLSLQLSIPPIFFAL